MRTWKNLYQDERGFVFSTELLLLATLVVIGILVGMAAWRDSVVQELGDSAVAIGHFSQGYVVKIVENPDQGIFVTDDDRVVFVKEFTNSFGDPVVISQSSFNNFKYLDLTDVGDEPDVAGEPPAGISFQPTDGEAN